MFEYNAWFECNTSLVLLEAKFSANGPKSTINSVNQVVTLSIVLKPRAENPKLRITADSMVSRALTRMVEAVKRNVHI